MADLIDRAELLKDFDTALDYGMTPYECLCSCTNRIIGASAVDAAPVIHGRWEGEKNSIGEHQCWIHREYFRDGIIHKCGSSLSYRSRYCPGCGAIMDGGAK